MREGTATLCAPERNYTHTQPHGFLRRPMVAVSLSSREPSSVERGKERNHSKLDLATACGSNSPGEANLACLASSGGAGEGSICT